MEDVIGLQGNRIIIVPVVPSSATA